MHITRPRLLDPCDYLTSPNPCPEPRLEFPKLFSPVTLSLADPTVGNEFHSQRRLWRGIPGFLSFRANGSLFLRIDFKYFLLNDRSPSKANRLQKQKNNADVYKGRYKEVPSPPKLGRNCCCQEKSHSLSTSRAHPGELGPGTQHSVSCHS